MAILEEFLRTGHLGPLNLGISSNDAMSILGEPDDISRKANPLLLRYGRVQLTFWKPRDAKPELREMTVDFQHASEPLPPCLEFTDWNSSDPPDEGRFRDFLHQIDYLPLQESQGVTGTELVFASGVIARFKDQMLESLRLTERENKKSTAVFLTDEREPTLEQISAMFNEADVAAQAGARTAALLIAWAGLEATLRRTASRAGRKSQIGTPLVVLLRELFAEGRMTGTDHAALENLRQLRMSAAHGLTPVAVPPNVVSHIKSISNRLLATTMELNPS